MCTTFFRKTKSRREWGDVGHILQKQKNQLRHKNKNFNLLERKVQHCLISLNNLET